MKRYCMFTLLVAVLFVARPVYATILFSEDFESDLSAWTTKPPGDPHHGLLVANPLGVGRVLTFTELNFNGDIFTSDTFHSCTGSFSLSFDYLGDPTKGGVPDDLGGFIGYQYRWFDTPPGPGSQVWLAGTHIGYPDILIDDGVWHHYEISFARSGDIKLMMEDYLGSGGYDLGKAGDAYFDNVVLTDTAVPEPTTLLLIASGLIVIATGRPRLMKRWVC
jgi:hypothetical protein